MEDRVRLLERVEAGELVMPKGAVALLRKEIGNYQAANAREAVILRKGWEPFTIPENMQLGLLEKRETRPSADAVGFSSIGLIVLGLASAVVGVALATIVAALVGVLTLLGGVLLVLLGNRGLSWAGRLERGSSLDPWVMQLVETGVGGVRLKSFSQLSTQCYFNSALPITVWEKAKADKLLFDQIYVGSMNRDLFSVEEIRVAPLGDPFLLGRIGEKFYVGAQWDLSEDLPTTGN